MTTRQLAGFVLRSSRLLLVGAALAVCVSVWACTQVPGLYKAQTKLLIGSADTTNGADYFALQTAPALAATYSQVITSRPVRERAIQISGLDVAEASTAAMISAQPIRGTHLILISVSAPDPRLAATIANSVAEAFLQTVEAVETKRYAAVEDSLSQQLHRFDATQADLARQLADAHARPSTPGTNPEVAQLQFAVTRAQQSYAAAQSNYQDVLLARARSTNPITVVDPATVPSQPDAQADVRLYVLTASAAGVLVPLTIGALFEYVASVRRRNRGWAMFA